MADQTKMRSKFKELEILFCYAEFYSNGKNLAVPTNPDKEKFTKIQKQIFEIKNKVID